MPNKHVVQSNLESYLTNIHNHSKQAHFGVDTSLFWRGVKTGRSGESVGKVDDWTKICVAADPLELCNLRSSPTSFVANNWALYLARPLGSK